MTAVLIIKFPRLGESHAILGVIVLVDEEFNSHGSAAVNCARADQGTLVDRQVQDDFERLILGELLPNLQTCILIPALDRAELRLAHLLLFAVLLPRFATEPAVGIGILPVIVDEDF